jgi:hypothetical protein
MKTMMMQTMKKKPCRVEGEQKEALLLARRWCQWRGAGGASPFVDGGGGGVRGRREGRF